MAQTHNIGFNGEGFVEGDKFLRRIPPLHLKDSGQISSAAFENYDNTNSFSTNWMKLSSVDDTLRSYPDFGVASLSAKLCWSLSQEIQWTPLEDNVAHCDIFGHKTHSIRKKLRDGAEYLVLPKKINQA